jgi:structure-specific recognition protein 1
MDFLEYSDIACEVRGDMTPGKLKLTDERLIWRGSRGNKREEVLAAGDLDLVNWQRLAGSWGLRIFTKDGALHRFAGFKEAEREKLAKYFKSSYKLDMLDRELSVKGWNYGTANFTGSVLGFEVGKADAFEVPLPYVNQCISGKNEVALEFHSVSAIAATLCAYCCSHFLTT